ncbi:Tyrocidine synthase [Trichinella spiralis]|uniref:Tyrocidine synthase n=1 Tax=Trichinella spiralis TaxID=6334 RepID=A0ABR3K4K4_TRISP
MIQNVINDPDECWLARVELFGTLGNKLLFFQWKKLCLLRAVRGRQFGPILTSRRRTIFQASDGDETPRRAVCQTLTATHQHLQNRNASITTDRREK